MNKNFYNIIRIFEIQINHMKKNKVNDALLTLALLKLNS